MDKLNQQSSRQRSGKEPSFVPEIFPTCGNGEIFHCEEIKLDEVLDESCKGILKFSSGTSSCFCRGANNLTRDSKHIEREGWSQFTR